MNHIPISVKSRYRQERLSNDTINGRADYKRIDTAVDVKLTTVARAINELKPELCVSEFS